MQKILFLYSDPSLVGAFREQLGTHDAEMHAASDWSQCQQFLLSARYDLACVDSRCLEQEPITTYLFLDNILQKEKTRALMLDAAMSEGVRSILKSLPSLGQTLDFDQDLGFGAELAQFLDGFFQGGAPEPAAVAPLFADSDPALLLDELSDGGEIELDDDLVIEMEEDSPERHLDVELPDPAQGELGRVPLGRLLYTLGISGSTGALELSMGSIRRRYAFSGGKLVQPAPQGYGDGATLKAAFAWTKASFEFQPQAMSGTTVPVLPMVREALELNITQRQLMEMLTPLFPTFPAPTNLWQERAQAIGWPMLAQFMQHCDGQTRLDMVLAKLGAQATQAFRAAIFARELDLLAFHKSADARPVIVSYKMPAAPQPAATPKATRKLVTRDPADKSAKSVRATGEDREQLEQELADLHDFIMHGSAYDILGLWEGCGSQEVRQTFYAKVKEHHPDVYGGNISGAVKKLAQDIFIAIKRAYTELLKVEKEQTSPRPELDEPTSRSPADSVEASANYSHSAASDVEESKPGATREVLEARVRAPEVRVQAPQKAALDEEARRQRLEALSQKAAKNPSVVTIAPRPAPGTTATTPAAATASTSASASGSFAKPAAASDGPAGHAPPRPVPEALKLPPRERFNEGFKYHRISRYPEALELFLSAYESDPDNGMYKTFFAYAMFRTDSASADEAEKILRDAIDMRHRQSLPDAYLFLGYMLKLREKHSDAIKAFETSKTLNPASHEAERELRLYERRKAQESAKPADAPAPLKGLFKK